jgi:quinol monooxygenase YgiN
MYGIIGRMKAITGQREALLGILLGSTQQMPGCKSYVIALDPTDADALWITEVWDNQESHRASLSLPQVRGAIEKAKPLIASFGERFVTEPVGGHGLS